MPDLARRSASEAIGSAWLVAAVVGSGILGERLAAGNVAIALLANTLATGAALVLGAFGWLEPDRARRAPEAPLDAGPAEESGRLAS